MKALQPSASRAGKRRSYEPDDRRLPNQGRRLCVRLVDPEHGDVHQVTAALIEAGISEIDTDMDGPRAKRMLDHPVATLGALANTVAHLSEAADAGARAVSLPNGDPVLTRAAIRRGPMVRACAFTTTECLQARDAGADTLLLYPARVLGPDGAQSIKAVSPHGTSLYAAGGIGVWNLAMWINAGIGGCCVGPSLYRPGVTVERAAAELTRL